MAKSANAEDRADLALSLAMITKRLNPHDRRQAVSPAIQILKSAFETEKLADARGNVAWCLAPLAERLGPEQGRKFAQPWPKT